MIVPAAKADHRLDAGLLQSYGYVIVNARFRGDKRIVCKCGQREILFIFLRERKIFCRDRIQRISCQRDELVVVKEVSDGRVKVHLHGRLGVIKVPERLIISEEPVAVGHEMEFYFSYVQITENPLDYTRRVSRNTYPCGVGGLRPMEYDASGMTPDHEPEPCLLGGTITEVNDTAIEVAIMNDLGSIAVPRRWAFTPVTLAEGQTAEFYFSCMKVIGRRDIPAEMI